MIDSETMSCLWWAHGIKCKPVILGWYVLSGTSQFSREFPTFFLIIESSEQAATMKNNYVMHKRFMH